MYIRIYEEECRAMGEGGLELWVRVACERHIME